MDGTEVEVTVIVLVVNGGGSEWMGQRWRWW